MRCAESLRVQAYFDGEADALSAADIERHVEHCDACRALLEDLEQTRLALRQGVPVSRAPQVLRSRIMGALDQECAVNTPRLDRLARKAWRSRPFWFGAISGIGTAAIAATVAFLILSPRLGNPLVDDLTGAHVRSLMATHLIDVASTDKHTVKPWFAGHADVSPVVADFEAEGYRLIGGRADYVDRQRSAVVVYQHGAHVINVFSWANKQRTLPNNASRNGYHLTFWEAGDLGYCAVSDAGWDELLGLARLLRELSDRNLRE